MKKILTALLLCLATMANAQEESIETQVWNYLKPHFETDTISGEGYLEQQIRLIGKYVPNKLMGERYIAMMAEQGTKYPSG